MNRTTCVSPSFTYVFNHATFSLAVQIYASYKHTRDVGGGAAGPGLPGRARPLRPEEAVAGAVGGVGLQLGAGGVGGGLMRQGVAWALAARAVAAREVAAAAAAVKADTRASDVKDVHITLQVRGVDCVCVLGV